jgi:hypothetical protein
MHHQISFVELADGKWEAKCSCGPVGVFDSKEKAQDYMNVHVGKLGVAFGVNTVGWSEKALPPPAPPAPPNVKPEDFEENLGDA